MFELGNFSEPLRPVPPGQVRLGDRTFDVRWISTAAPHKDQDALLVAGGFSAVADGATPLSGDGREVARFARDALDALESSKDLPVEQMYRAAVDRLRQTRGTPTRGTTSTGAPSCAIAIARECAGEIELSSLCDSFAVARLVDGTYVVVQNNAPPVDTMLNEYMGQLLEQGMSVEEARVEIFKILSVERPRLMNRPGGYWVFADDPGVGREAVTASIPVDQVDAILLATDGFGRLFDLFGAVGGPEELLELAVRDGLPELHRLLRRLELTPGSMRLHPRPSIQDDATAILLTRPVCP